MTAVGLKTAKVGGVTVLTNAKGFTLYSFAPDTSTTSKCNGTCAQSWPPVKPGTASGVKGAFGTIKRSDGSAQLTFHGHPLYTFVGDTVPRAGQRQRHQRVRRTVARSPRVRRRGARGQFVIRRRRRLRVLTRTAPGPRRGKQMTATDTP